MTDCFAKGVTSELSGRGYAIRDHAAMRDWIGDAWTGWDEYAASWNDLAEDRYMADGGRYRRRRYAVFDIAGSTIIRAPHQPHFQARTYNRLNGGVARWFEPVTNSIAAHPITQRILQGAAGIFTNLFAGDEAEPSWHAEMHQFRIEASQNRTGLPTQEGVHRDGVDGAVVMLIKRRNISSGVTELFDAAKQRLGSFTLAEPADAVFIDDTRIFHGVTPIAPLDPQSPATRDVLVVTFQRARNHTNER